MKTKFLKKLLLFFALFFGVTAGAEVVDTTPDSFSFSSQTNIATNTAIISNQITISGIDTASNISISNGEYSINNGAFSSNNGTVNNDNTVSVRHTSSSNYNSSKYSVLTIGGISATFTSTTQQAPVIQTYTLTITTPTNGTISATGISCGVDCSETYNENTQVQLTASANSDYVFNSWSGDCSGANNPLTINMDSNKSCGANFILSLDTDTDGTPDAIDTDNDNDGIHDSFEVSNGLDPLDASDANGDLDGDGFSNLAEYNASTDLDNSNDSPNTYIDYSAAQNQYGGFFNAPNIPNSAVFAALKSDGSITAWGNGGYGGIGEPTDTGYVKIYPAPFAFAAIKADGSITAWGISFSGGTDAPTDTGYVKIYSTIQSLAAIKADGSITAWGDSFYGGSGAPTDTGYVEIYSNHVAFAALKADGSITAWGDSTGGGSGAPTDTGYVKIYSTTNVFAALKADGSITAWGNFNDGGSAPTDTGYVKIYSTNSAFAALKADGSITAWGDSTWGGSGAPTDTGYVKIYSTDRAFAALKADGSITAWGYSHYGGTDAPTDTGYVKIYSAARAFAALKSDGSITVWGSSSNGGSGAPTDTGYVEIYSTAFAFAALKADGSITVWGGSSTDRNDAPTDTGYQFNGVITPAIYQLTINDINNFGVISSNPVGISCVSNCSNSYADGTHIILTASANSGYKFSNWTGDCSGTDNSLTIVMDSDKSCSASFVIFVPSITLSVATVNAELDVAITNVEVTNSGGTATSYAISPPLINGLSFASATGTISGTPSATATLQAYTITATNITGSDSATVKISVSQITSKPSIADITATQSYFVDVAIISPITFTNTGGVTQECASSGLPAGLNVSVSGNSCAISGTPQQISSATAYTIIATNSQGSDTAIININIDPATPSITISVNSFTATVGVAITDITVTNTGGTAALYAISQPLSAGLSFSTATGTISGIPNATASTIIYTITASNVTGSDSATISIEVKNFSLDADGNGTIGASNDGLIIFKYLLNSNANNLHTTISSNAMEGRKTTTELKAYLDDAGTILDADGNQTINASNDGLIIFKYLLNSNANNLHTTISSNAMEGRKTTPQLKAYLDKFR